MNFTPFPFNKELFLFNDDYFKIGVDCLDCYNERARVEFSIDKLAP